MRPASDAAPADPVGPADERPRASATGGILRRLVRSWGTLEREQRTAAATALALFATMFLPWYSKTAVGVVKGAPVKVDDTFSAFQSFSFVEAAVLLVAVGVLWMLFARGEQKAFHLPFGDGNVICAAGLWVCLLVFYRQFDKPSPGTAQGLATSVGVSWGIFVTFLTGLFLAFSGQRLRAASLTEPPLPGDVAPSDDDGAVIRATRGRARPGPDVAHTVVDRRGPSVDETLMAPVPEYTPVPNPVPPTPEYTPVPPEPPTAADPDGQLRFEG